MAIRRKRATKKSNGHPFLVLLFFIILVVGSAYMTDRMTNAPTADNADQVTAIRHIFNDKEMQGLVPKEDQGTPESVKEKIKDIINKTVVVEAKADDEDTPKAAEVTKADGKTERMKEDERDRAGEGGLQHQPCRFQDHRQRRAEGGNTGERNGRGFRFFGKNRERRLS